MQEDYTVAMLLPSTFQTYARLLHPIVPRTDAGCSVTRWRDVAATTNGIVHSRVQFATLAASRIQGDRPPSGTIPTSDARILIDVLAQIMRTGDRCWFGLWIRYGEIISNVAREPYHRLVQRGFSVGSTCVIQAVSARRLDPSPTLACFARSWRKKITL